MLKITESRTVMVLLGIALAGTAQAATAPTAQPLAPPEKATSQRSVFAITSKSPTVKALDIQAIPFTAPSGPVFDISNIHITMTRQANGVFVETRITGSPYKRHYTSDGTPFVITVKAGNQALFRLTPIEWTVTCFRTDIFGAKTLVASTAFDRIDSIEVAPMQATSRFCISPPIYKHRH